MSADSLLGPTKERLQEFDVLVGKSRGTGNTPAESEKYQELALRSILAIAGHDIKEDEDTYTKALSVLDHSDSMMDPRVVAICFLRLLPARIMTWLTDTPWRPKIVTLFDSQLDELYRDRKIEPKLQAHEKISKMSTVVREYEQQFNVALQALTSLGGVGGHRQKLMNALNSRVGRMLMQPFLPDDSEARLSELYFTRS